MVFNKTLKQNVEMIKNILDEIGLENSEIIWWSNEELDVRRGKLPSYFTLNLSPFFEPREEKYKLKAYSFNISYWKEEDKSNFDEDPLHILEYWKNSDQEKWGAWKLAEKTFSKLKEDIYKYDKEQAEKITSEPTNWYPWTYNKVNKLLLEIKSKIDGKINWFRKYCFNSLVSLLSEGNEVSVGDGAFVNIEMCWLGSNVRSPSLDEGKSKLQRTLHELINRTKDYSPKESKILFEEMGYNITFRTTLSAENSSNINKEHPLVKGVQENLKKVNIYIPSEKNPLIELQIEEDRSCDITIPNIKKIDKEALYVMKNLIIN